METQPTIHSSDIPILEEKKTTRKRKPWVYKEQYERLLNKYVILTYIAWAGWIAFLVTLKFVV